MDRIRTENDVEFMDGVFRGRSINGWGDFCGNFVLRKREDMEFKKTRE